MRATRRRWAVITALCRSFNAPNQKYFYSHGRLNPVGCAGGDTSRTRRVWRFETSPGIRSFSFVVLIAAPWPAPHESRWRVQYRADALPGASAPPLEDGILVAGRIGLEQRRKPDSAATHQDSTCSTGVIQSLPSKAPTLTPR